MWSDIVQHAERLHFLRLCFWGALSTLAGTVLVLVSVARQGVSTLLRGFGSICALLGAVELILGALNYRHVSLRDISAATRLDRMAWLQLGLYLGIAGVGASLALSTHRWSRRSGSNIQDSLPTIGTGLAVLLHGIALATLELFLIADISR